jgi:acyl carrier protein
MNHTSAETVKLYRKKIINISMNVIPDSENFFIHEIHDLTDPYVTALLKSGLSDIKDDNLAKNYHPNYMNEFSGNLFFILQNGRYRKGKGKYYVVENLGKYVCSAGWNEYEDDPSTAFALSRMYVATEYRGNYPVGNYILPRTLRETRKYQNIWLTVNEHNKVIYSWFERSFEKKATALFNDWPEIYRQFEPIGKKTIYTTTQYIMGLKKKAMTTEEKIELLIEGIKSISHRSADSTIDSVTINGDTLLSDLGLDSLDIVELQIFYEENTGHLLADPKKELLTINNLLEIIP